jgi:hypothetical protein
MATKDQKSALSASMKAEEKKVTAAQSPAATNSKKPVQKTRIAVASSASKATATATKAKPAATPKSRPKAAAATKARPAAAPKTRPAAAAKPVKASPVTAPAKAEKTDKSKMAGKHVAPQKVVRDSFTMPKDDYAMIAILKKKATEMGIVARKSEILRAGLKALSGLNLTQLKTRLASVEKIKTGRPHKGKAKGKGKKK